MKKLGLILLLFLATIAPALTIDGPMLGVQPNWAHPLAKGLVGGWFFTEQPGVLGRANDITFNRNHGTLIADTHSVPGKFGPALSFDGTGDYMTGSIPPLQNESAYTYILHLKWPYVHNKIILNTKDTNNDRHILILQANNVLSLHRYFGALASNQSQFAVLGDNFHHIAVVCQASSTPPELYLDGVKQTSTGTPGGYGKNGVANELKLGDRLGAGGYGATAIVDYLTLYNRALSDQEIAWLYREPFAMFRQDLILTAAAPPAPGNSQFISIITGSMPPILIMGCVVLVQRKMKIRKV